MLPGKGVAIGLVRAIGAGAQVRKISPALRIRRHFHVVLVRIFFTPPLFREKEERLFLFRVVQMRNENRPAHGVTEIVLLVRRIRMRGIRARFPRPRVEHIVAQVFERAAMEVELVPDLVSTSIVPEAFLPYCAP